MAGQVKNLLDQYIQEMSGGDKAIAKTLYTRLALRGIIHTKYNSESDDDPVMIDRLHHLAMQANIHLEDHQ